MIQLMTKTSNGNDQAYYKEAYRARLLELADTTVEPCTEPETIIAAPAAEPPPPVAAAAPDLVPAPAPDPAPFDGFADVAAKIANSLTECWSGALTEVDRRAAIDRSELQTALTTLASLAGKIKDLSDHNELVDRNYHDLAARLFRVEERMEAQGTSLSHMEQTVSSQVAIIENRIMPTLTGISDGMGTLTQALDAHSVAIENLTSAAGKADAAQRSILERLERQAQAIQSVHAAMESQAQRWQALKQAATELASRFEN